MALFSLYCCSTFWKSFTALVFPLIFIHFSPSLALSKPSVLLETRTGEALSILTPHAISLHAHLFVCWQEIILEGSAPTDFWPLCTPFLLETPFLFPPPPPRATQDGHPLSIFARASSAHHTFLILLPGFLASSSAVILLPFCCCVALLVSDPFFINTTDSEYPHIIFNQTAFFGHALRFNSWLPFPPTPTPDVLSLAPLCLFVPCTIECFAASLLPSHPSSYLPLPQLFL